MAFAIWKFPVLAHASSVVVMPIGAQILAVQIQRGQPQMWALVNPYAEKEERHFYLFGTGGDVPEDLIRELRYIGTFMLHAETYVLHLFERLKNEKGDNSQVPRLQQTDSVTLPSP